LALLNRDYCYVANIPFISGFETRDIGAKFICHQFLVNVFVGKTVMNVPRE